MLTNPLPAQPASDSKNTGLTRTRRVLATSICLIGATLATAHTVWAQAPADPAAAAPTAQKATAPIQIQENAPDRYTVVKGDTLWAISSRFLKAPWRWPEVWRMNKSQIRNPHLIYPGQVVVLDRNAPGGPRLMIDPNAVPDRGLVKLSPTIRAEGREAQAIPSIAPGDIEPFLLRNVVIGAESFDTSAQIVRSVGEHVAFSTADAFYAVGVTPEMGKVFQVFRKGRELRDPTIPKKPWYRSTYNEPDPQVIGYEANFLGEARLVTAGQVAKLEVVSVRQEILVGDYLIPAVESEVISYVPRAPDKPIDAVVMTLPSGISEATKTNVITFNRGKNHGVEVGHVLAAFKPKEEFANPRYKESSLSWIPSWDKWPYEKSKDPKTLTIPEERVGLVFVYRVFDNISYGMVMNSGQEPVRGGYRLTNPLP
jgi:LysM domain